MKNLARRIRMSALAALAASLALTATVTLADTGYPQRPVTVVVPYSPGGGVDIITRLIAGPIGQDLGQSIVVDNKPGGGTNIGMSAVARSPADGYTLLMASNTYTTNHALYSSLNFDLETGFAPIGQVGEAALVVVVNAKSPYQTLQNLIDAGKDGSARLNYGTAGIGSSGHMASELLLRAANFKAVHVPYKGGSAAVTDLLGGRLDFMAINPLEVVSYVNAGSLRALAVLNHGGSALLPQVPTAASLGYDVEATVWWGLVAPAGTPDSVMRRLHAALQRALENDAVLKRLAEIGATPKPGTSEEFAEFTRSESATLGELIRSVGIKAD